MKARRVVITGISGLVGSHIARRLEGRCEVIGISRKPGKISKSILPEAFDITDSRALVSFLERTEFDALINCAAQADVDRCEIDREEAYKINTEAVAVMADFCKKHKRLLIHLSTDYLFDGQNGPYSEEASSNPINYYGETKLEAEIAIRSSGCAYIIVRTNHIYGNLPDGPSRLVRWLLENSEIKAASDQYNNSIWAGSLADSVIELMEMDFRSVVNIGGPDYLSRYEFAMEGAEVFGIDKKRVVKSSIKKLGLVAPRPLMAGLIIDKMKQILKTAPVSVVDGLKKVRDGAL
ncbi:MAG TPA: hypothetical protein DEO84_02345 [candidate division Zixibacteria bacterium]|nr:hypothetical protein [candidate division Zixibacteria bacterium]